jgi:hypothetical protein
MNYDNPGSPFSRAVLTAVFVGFISTIVCLFYNIIYRDTTHFLEQDIVNVSSLIFAVNLVFLLIGFIYYFFRSRFKKGDMVFTVAFIVLTLLGVWWSETVTRSSDHHLTVEFRGLMLGIVIIIGVGSVLIPYLFRSKSFEEHVV